MATDSASRSVTNTLTTTVADTVTLTNGWKEIAVVNHTTNTTLSFRWDGTTAVADADNVISVPPSTIRTVPVGPNSSGQVVVSIVGSATKYSIEGIR